MSQLLEIQPSSQLKFILEVTKQSTCNVRLINKTDQHVAFKVKTTSPKKYCVRPNVGVVLPKETFDFVVIMQSQRSPPTDLVCKDKFLIQSTTVPAGTMEEDVTSHMFSKDDGKYIEEKKLKVILVSPPHSPELSPMHPKSKLVPPVQGSVVADGMFSRTERYSSHHVDVEHTKELKTANKEVEKPIADVKPEAVKSMESELTKAAEPVTVRDAEHAKELKIANKEVEKPIADVELEAVKSVESEPTKAAGPVTWRDVEHSKELKMENKEVEKPIADVKREAVERAKSELTKVAEPVIVRDVESQPIKAVESDPEDELEARPVKETKPTVLEDALDLRLVKDVELIEAVEPVNMMDVESPPVEIMESNSVSKLGATSVGGIEPRMIKDAKDLRSMSDVELAKVEPVAMKDVESPPIKFVESNLLDKLEARPGKGLEPTMMKDAKDLGFAKYVELKKAAPVTVRDVESSPIKSGESNSVDKVVATPMKGTNPKMKTDAEDLSIVKDIEVLKSKLLQLESKFGQAEKNISKLIEERRSTTQEREFIQQELAILRTHRVHKAVHEGFPPSFLWLVAVISIVIGYRLHP